MAVAFPFRDWLNDVDRVDDAALSDLEQRVATWVNARIAEGGGGIVVQQTEPLNPVVNTLWVEIDGATPPNIVALHVAMSV